MKTFNRAVVILEIVLLIILLIVAAVVPYTVLERLRYTVEQGQNALQYDWPRSYIIFLVVDIVVIFVLLVLLWLEIRPQTRRTITVRGRDGTEAEVSTPSVAQSLQYAIADIGDISKARATVRGVRTGVDVVLDLETAPEIDIPSKMDQVSQAARDLIEGKMGLHVARIKVNVKQAPYGKVAAPAPRPAVQPSVFPEPSAAPDVQPSMPEDTEVSEQPQTEFPAGEGDPYSEL
jgi:hypothetical protein